MPTSSADDTGDSASDTASTTPRGADNIIEFAIADLHARLGADVDVTVVSIEEVDWPDGSVGCPQPGMMYTQAIVNGSKIVLLAGGIQYAYHQESGRDPFYCPPMRDKQIAPPPTADLDI